MSFKVSQSAMSSPVPLVPVPQRHSHSATVADPSMYVNEHEHCLCLCLSQSTSLSARLSPVFVWRLWGVGELGGHPWKNRHPTSMLNLEMACCLGIVCLCKIDGVKRGGLEVMHESLNHIWRYRANPYITVIFYRRNNMRSSIVIYAD